MMSISTEEKLEVIKEIAANKNLLIFRKFSGTTVTNETIKQGWTNCLHRLQANGFLLGKDVTYLKDTLWAHNILQVAKQKVDRMNRTGSSGGKAVLLTEVDRQALDVVGSRSPLIQSNPVSDSYSTQLNVADNCGLSASKGSVSQANIEEEIERDSSVILHELEKNSTTPPFNEKRSACEAPSPPKKKRKIEIPIPRESDDSQEQQRLQREKLKLSLESLRLDVALKEKNLHFLTLQTELIGLDIEKRRKEIELLNVEIKSKKAD